MELEIPVPSVPKIVGVPSLGSQEVFNAKTRRCRDAKVEFGNFGLCAFAVFRLALSSHPPGTSRSVDARCRRVEPKSGAEDARTLTMTAMA